MSTKINVRSPYFLEFTEPTPTFGTFDCNTADLQNFAVSSAGVITVPTPRYGTIIDQTATNFAQNTSGSAISRTVTYTIRIPEGYSNYADGTIDCDATVDQPTQSAQEDPNTNNNCPTFSGTIPNATNTTSTTVNLSTYFTAGSGASISSYQVIKTGDSGITYSVSSNTLTIESSINCLSASFTVIARNASDACTAASNSFSFSTPCTEDFDCNDVNLTGGRIEQDGTVHKSSFVLGDGVKELLYNGSVITAPYNVGANTSGSSVQKTITYRMYIPQGYNNYSVGATIDCDKTYTQPSTVQLPEFNCAEANLTNAFISKKGNIAAPTVERGTLVSWTPQSFDPVTTYTQRNVTFTITPPATGYTNSGGSNITCVLNLTQPPTIDTCGSTNLYVTTHSSTSIDGFCGTAFTTDVPVTSSVSAFADIRSTLGQQICYRGSLFRGGNKYYGYSSSSTGQVGDIGATFYLLQIDDFGIVQDIAIYNCSGSGSGGSI